MKSVPSPNKSSRKGHKIGLIVIHADAGKSDAGTVSWIKSPDSHVSYHYLVGRDAEIYKFVPEEEKAWHAGKSTWPGFTVGDSVNPTSIGVAFANDGTGEEAYSAVQYRAGAKLVAEIMDRHGIGLTEVRGHNEVSPGRKQDPYDWFSWRHFHALLTKDENTEDE